MEDRDQVITAIVGADDLLEQYFTVLDRLARAAKDGKDDEFSLHIADANRVYGGVWDQLDHAYELLSRGGMRSRDYQEIRADQGASSQLGVLDSDSSVQLVTGALALGVIGTQTELAAQTNLRGARAAQHASQALKTTLPEVDWAAERAAREQEHVELRGGFKNTRIVAIAVAVLLGLGLVYLIVSNL